MSIWKLEQQGAIARLTLHDAEGLNLLSTSTFDALYDHLQALSEDESLSLLILTGAGDRAFSAGANLSQLITMGEEAVQAFVAAGDRALSSLMRFPLPTMAAVNGYALGAGFELMMSCDLRYGSDEIEIGQPAVTLGFVPPFGSVERLTRLLGVSRATEVLLRGQRFEYREAVEFGLLQRAFPSAEFENQISAIAHDIAQSPRGSLKLAKKWLTGAITPIPPEQSHALCEAIMHPQTHQNIQQFLDP